MAWTARTFEVTLNHTSPEYANPTYTRRVSALKFEIVSRGHLRFLDSNMRATLAYAPGIWIQVEELPQP